MMYFNLIFVKSYRLSLVSVIGSRSIYTNVKFLLILLGHIIEDLSLKKKDLYNINLI